MVPTALQDIRAVTERAGLLRTAMQQPRHLLWACEAGRGGAGGCLNFQAALTQPSLVCPCCCQTPTLRQRPPANAVSRAAARCQGPSFGTGGAPSPAAACLCRPAPCMPRTCEPSQHSRRDQQLHRMPMLQHREQPYLGDLLRLMERCRSAVPLATGALLNSCSTHACIRPVAADQ